MNKKCKWSHCGICTNSNCPLMSSNCLVVNHHGVCKYEDLVDDKAKMANVIQTNNVLSKVNSTNDTDGIRSDDKLNLDVGQVLCRNDVENSSQWRCKSFAGEPYNNACCYISKDEKWVIRFGNGRNTGTVAPWYKHEDFVVGKQVHVGAISESREWEYIGENDGITCYQTRDKMLTVSFRQDSDWGTIMLCRDELISYECGGIREGDSVSAFDLAGNKQWTRSNCDNDSIMYVSTNGLLKAVFDSDIETSVVLRVK